jgi:hypothetical protein
MTKSYIDYVFEQRQRNPCLQNLCHFLEINPAQRPCRLALLGFPSKGKPLVHHVIKPSDLEATLSEMSFREPRTNGGLVGHILIVEDLRNDVIETLGSTFNIDPLFFASHIYGPYMRISSRKLWAAIQLSRARDQNFLRIQYHQALEFSGNPGTLRKAPPLSNLPRELLTLPPIENKYVGLAQHSCSVILTRMKERSWFGNVLRHQRSC